jgi:hypothetical protein
LAALFGDTTGSVTLWSLRIPHLCFFLAGTLLIYNLLRSVTGKSAAIFGALCWISMPVVAPKFIDAEPDIVKGDATNHNMPVYVKGPISAVSLNDLAALNPPAMAVLRPEHERALSQMNSKLHLVDKDDIVCGKIHYKIVDIIPPERTGTSQPHEI